MYAQPTLNGAPGAPASYSNPDTFGATSVRIIPIPATYQSGYLAGQGFPAENENYLMYNTTLAINAIANDISNIHAEILTILTEQSITPNGTVTQLNTAIGNKISSAITASQPTQSKDIINHALNVSVSSNAMTVALKQSDGSTDPSSGAGNIKISFRQTTITVGNYIQRIISSALSLVVPSGATLGQVNATPGFLYIYALDNSGTVELAISGTDCWDDGVLQSTTVLDTASDSATVLYSTTARSSVAIRFLGIILITQTTAGTWASNPTRVSDYPCSRNLTPIKSSVVRSSPISIISNTSKTITSITLPPGIWDIRGHGGFQGAGSASMTTYSLSISKTNNTQNQGDAIAVPLDNEYTIYNDSTQSVSPIKSIDISPYRIYISSQTQFFLVAFVVFGGGTFSAFGEIEAEFVHS